MLLVVVLLKAVFGKIPLLLKSYPEGKNIKKKNNKKISAKREKWEEFFEETKNEEKSNMP